jgi:hypothetical protein
MRIKLLFATIFSLVAILIAAGCSILGSPPGDGGDSGNGTIIIDQQTVPPGQPGTIQFTGVPTGTISGDATLVVSDLEPGTYTSTEIDPAPDFDVTAVECDDGDSASPSSGDPQTRTAIFNLDPGETVTCTFTNTRRGSLVIAGQTVPDGTGGTFQFTGVPTGTITSNGTLVVANLEPGTYTSTEVDPAPDFDVTAVECDDGDSASPSNGDPQTRTAVFNLDPGEQARCAFTNTRRGTAVIAGQTIPDGSDGTLQFTGVPTGTISSNGTLVVANLKPGTYTSTEVDPAPDFDLTAVECDDGASASPSSGDPATRSAIFNIDPGETVTCTFTNENKLESTPVAAGSSGGPGDQDGGQSSSESPGDLGGGLNPFEGSGGDLEDFPVPDELPPGAGTFDAPRPGPWSVTHFEGAMNCGTFSLAIPASPPDNGVLDVQDGGRTVIGTGLESAQGVSITMTANPDIRGRYTGSFQGQEQGVPVTINYFWQVVTDEYIVGYLTASLTYQGVTCTVHRPYEMRYAGD